MNINQEALIFKKQLDNSPLIATLKTKTLEKLLANNQTIIEKEGETVKGFVGFKKLTSNVCELSPIFVKEEFENNGVGRKLVSRFIEENSGQDILAITKNPKLIKLLNENGFRLTTFQQLPLPVRISLVLSIKPYRILDSYKKGILTGWKYYIKLINY